MYTEHRSAPGLPCSLERTQENLRDAPNRPRSLRLAETDIKTDKAVSRRMQLLDQNNKPRQTHALVLKGESFRAEGPFYGCLGQRPRCSDFNKRRLKAFFIIGSSPRILEAGLLFATLSPMARYSLHIHIAKVPSVARRNFYN